jgi:hypothetical protein
VILLCKNAASLVACLFKAALLGGVSFDVTDANLVRNGCSHRKPAYY